MSLGLGDPPTPETGFPLGGEAELVSGSDAPIRTILPGERPWASRPEPLLQTHWAFGAPPLLRKGIKHPQQVFLPSGNFAHDALPQDPDTGVLNMLGLALSCSGICLPVERPVLPGKPSGHSLRLGQMGLDPDRTCQLRPEFPNDPPKVAMSPPGGNPRADLKELPVDIPTVGNDGHRSWEREHGLRNGPHFPPLGGLVGPLNWARPTPGSRSS